MHMQYTLAEWPETSNDSPGGRAVHPGKQAWLPAGSYWSGVHPCVTNTRPPASKPPRSTLLSMQIPGPHPQGSWFGGSEVG